MANIIEYNAPNRDVPQPTDRAADTAREVGMLSDRFLRQEGEVLGSALGRAGQSIGETIERHQTSQWISHGSAVSSSLFADLTDKWNKMASGDPNDTSIAQGFKESLDQDISKFQDSFEGATPQAQAWALSRADQMRDHFTQTVIPATMATRAAAAATQNIQSTVRNYSHIVGSDPTALPQTVDHIKSDFEALINSHGLKAEEAAQIRNELVPKAINDVAKSAFQRMVDVSPTEAVKAVGAGKFDNYWDEPQKSEAVKYAESMQRMKLSDQSTAYELQKRQLHDTREAKQDTYIQDIVAGRGISAAKVATDKELGPEQRENIINFQAEHTRQLRESKDNIPHPETFRSLLNGMFDTARNDPNNLSVDPVRTAFKKGLLNPAEEETLERRFVALDKPLEQNFHNQVLRVEHSIASNPIYGPLFATDPGKLQTIITRIESDAYQKIELARHRGEDISPLIDPTSTTYLFKPAIIRSYLQDRKDAIAQEAGKLTGGGATGTWGKTQEFKTSADLDAAAKAGKVKDKEKIIVNGQTGIWRDPNVLKNEVGQ